MAEHGTEDYDLESQFPDDFSGSVRLFPLPDSVLFPGVAQPLHLFEPRYCQLLQDALADDQLIAMAWLRPGWQTDYEGRPPIAPVTCIGRVISHNETSDGRYNIMLLGIRRATVTAELPPAQSYRMADVELLDDRYEDGGGKHRAALRQELLDVCRRFIAVQSSAHQQYDQLLTSQLQLGRLTDILSYATSLPVATKQQLLSECHVEQRAQLLIRALHKLISVLTGESGTGAATFPPQFSDN